ncbi:hypothetical protein SUGI_0976240 [Cryptomeria japonica]|nr:hypothetical protein SUGI_0976240 [Cryptomeria japonica]
MAGNKCELEQLETQIAIWKSSRASLDAPIEFIVRRGHIEMRMNGLVWSIEALPRPDTMDYNFSNIELKRSKSPLYLPFKFKLLLEALQTYIRSVLRMEDLLDKLYVCSCFLSWAENDKRCLIIVDAQIMAVACDTAREAIQQAAEAAAAFLAELMPCFSQQNIITQEVWATSFYATEMWNRIAQAAVDGGSVHQWCMFQVSGYEKIIPYFEFEVAIQDFLHGNDAISRIGVVNSHPLKVTVDFEDEFWVVCSQEGVETETSYGLRSLLPELIRNYITTALEINEGEDGVNNIVEGLAERVVGDSLPLTWTSDDQRNMEAAQQRLSSLHLTDGGGGNENAEDLDDDDDDGNENAEDPFN